MFPAATKDHDAAILLPRAKPGRRLTAAPRYSFVPLVRFAAAAQSSRQIAAMRCWSENRKLAEIL